MKVWIEIIIEKNREMYRNRGQTRIPSFAMFLLINELIRSATTYGIPTITFAFIVGQILIFLRIIPVLNILEIDKNDY
jgi:hypothetical protein